MFLAQSIDSHGNQPIISDKIVETFYSVDIHKRQSATTRKLQLEADKKET